MRNVSSKKETNREDKKRGTKEVRKTERKEKSDERRDRTEHRHEIEKVVISQKIHRVFRLTSGFLSSY